MSKLHFKRVAYEEAPNLDVFDDGTIFQTKQWLNFITNTQSAEPVIATMKKGNQTVGRFTGLLVKKFGIPILGSPFPGWSTSYMGFNLIQSISRTDALLALQHFAFHDLKCAHFELMDRRLTIENVKQLGFNYRLYSGYEVDLTKDEDRLFSSMKSACRRCIRKAEKEHVWLEVADEKEFIDDYYAQMQDVFAKQNLVPTYSKKRIELLLEHLRSLDCILLVRARSKDGTSLATGIFPAFNDTMYFWGGASWRQHQHLRPNEALQWFAMRYWKSRGISKYDMGGSGNYKRKYGGQEITIPWVRKSKYPILERLRSKANNLYTVKQKILGFCKR